MKMKKILSIMIISIMILSFSACKNGSSTIESENQEKEIINLFEGVNIQYDGWNSRGTIKIIDIDKLYSLGSY